jgi:hypothetical protein
MFEGSIKMMVTESGFLSNFMYLDQMCRQPFNNRHAISYWQLVPL